MASRTATLAVRIISDSRDAVRGISETGSKFGALGKSAKVAGAAAKVAGGAVTGVLGTALFKGFNRLSSIDQATHKLEGLGYSAGDTKSIMDDATKSVKGTAFGLDEAAAAAAGALASGIKPGKDLTRYLSLTGDAATQAGTDFSSMAQMMGKVQGQGKLTGNVVSQMSENGLYVLPMLAKAFHKPQSAIQKMVSEGKISAKQFQSVLEKKIGGSAKKSGDTVKGAWANVNAALGRVGASLLSGVFPKIAPLLKKVTTGLDDIGKVAEPIGAQIGAGIAVAVDWLSKLDVSFSGVSSGLSGFTPVLDAVTTGWDNISVSLAQAWTDLQPLVATVRDELIPQFIAFYQQIMPPVIAAIMSIIPPLLEAGVAVAGLVVAIQTRMMPVIRALAPVVITVFQQVANIIRAALKVVTAIIKTATALIKGDWSGVWSGIKEIVRTTLALIGTIIKAGLKVAKSLLSVGLSALKSVMSSVWSGIQNVVSGAWGRIKSAVVTGASNVKTEVGKLPGQAKTAVGNLGSTLYSAGTDLIGGLISGIIRKAGSIASTIKNYVTDKIPGWVKGPLGINSPSKVMADIAQWIPAGIAAGITGNTGHVKDAMRRLSGDVTKAGIGSPKLPAVTVDTTGGRRAGTGRRPVNVTVNVSGFVGDDVALLQRIRDGLADLDVLVGA